MIRRTQRQSARKRMGGKRNTCSDHPRAAARIHELDTLAQPTREVGAPVTVAAVSLVLGFWVGAFGSFSPTVYFSLLSGLAMITGVLCDLLVLPAVLVLIAGK